MHGRYSASVEENSLCECGLTRVYVGRDTDVPDLGHIHLLVKELIDWLIRSCETNLIIRLEHN